MERSAADWKGLAVYYCKKGDHTQARDCFLEAARLYLADHDGLEAGRCIGEAEGEERLICRQYPVNVSALVD